MRNFFSPFLNLKLDSYKEKDSFVAHITMYEQNRHNIFLITLSNAIIMNSMEERKFEYVSFSSALRDDKPCLVVEGSTRKAEGKVTQLDGYLRIRSQDQSFLPLNAHKQKDIVGHIYEVGQDDVIFALSLPDDYRITHNAQRSPIQFVEQPVVKDWPAFD